MKGLDVRSGSRRIELAVVAVAAAWTIGACNDPVVRQRSAARVRAVGRTVRSLDIREKERPKAVAADFASIDRMLHDSADGFVAHYATYRQRWQQEVDGWRQRQPDYQRAIAKEFQGNVKRAHDTAVQVID